MKHKKIVLIQPGSKFLIDDKDIPSLGILYLSSFLKQKGFEVTVVDLASEFDSNKWKIPAGDIYGISFVTALFYEAKKIAEILKKRELHKIIIAGGPHPTVLPKQTLENTEIDIVVRSEGQVALYEIMKGNSIESIRNVSYLKDGKYFENPIVLEKDLDTFPFPDRAAIDFFKYIKSKTFSYIMGEVNQGTIFSSIGCPFSCAFCASKTIHNRRVRFFSIDHVVNEIKHLIDEYNIQLIEFLDDTLVIDKKRFLRLCSELKKLNIKWHGLNRVDCVDKENVIAMKESGCLGMMFGFESGPNRILKLMNKKATVEQAYRAIELLKKYAPDISIRGQMIVGFPGENWESVKETGEFIKNATHVKKFGIHMFRNLPGSLVFNNPKKYNYIPDKNDLDFGMMHTIGKPLEQLSSIPEKIEWIEYLRDIAKNKEIAIGLK